MSIIPTAISYYKIPVTYYSDKLNDAITSDFYNPKGDDNGDRAIKFLTEKEVHLIPLEDLKKLAAAKDTFTSHQHLENYKRMAQVMLIVSIAYGIFRFATATSGDTSPETTSLTNKIIGSLGASSLLFILIHSLWQESRSSMMKSACNNKEMALTRIETIYMNAAQNILRRYREITSSKESHSSAKSSSSNEDPKAEPEMTRENSFSKETSSEMNLTALKAIDISYQRELLLEYMNTKDKERVDQILKPLAEVIAYIKDPSSLPTNLGLLSVINFGSFGSTVAGSIETAKGALSLIRTGTAVIKSWYNSGVIDELKGVLTETGIIKSEKEAKK